MNRRTLLLALAAASAAPGSSFAQAPAAGAVPTGFRVYVGTYTKPGKSQGIYQFELDLEGTLTAKGLAAETPSPSFLALGPDAKTLYAVNEVNEFAGRPEGGVSAFAIDIPTGALRPINQQPSGGTGPCHITVGPDGRSVMVANYGGGSIASFPVGPDGTLGRAATTIIHQGKGPNPRRQEKPHAHSVDLDPTRTFLLVNDLGLDKTFVYRLNAATALLTPNEAAPFAPSRPGAGPRHLAFHPTSPFVYVINELDSTITVSAFDAAVGSLRPVQSISTLPPEVKPGSSTAEVAVHPSGRFVYGSNRGADTLAIFRVDPATGQLALVGFQPTGGKTPRNFAIDPTGTLLLAANQDSDSITVFRIDPNTGALTQVGDPVATPIPVSILFAPRGEGR